MKYNQEQLRTIEDIDLRDAHLKELSDYWSEFLNEIPEDANNTEYLIVGCGGYPSTEEFIDELDDGYGGDDYESYK